MRLLETNVRTWCRTILKVTVKLTNGKNRKYEMNKTQIDKNY